MWKTLKCCTPFEKILKGGTYQITYKFRLILFFLTYLFKYYFDFLLFKFNWNFFCTHIDLQFSTDDEEFEEVVGDFETAAAVLGQGEGLARSAQPVNYMPGNNCCFVYLSKKKKVSVNWSSCSPLYLTTALCTYSADCWFETFLVISKKFAWHTE